MAKTTTHADYTATALTLTTAAQPNITSVGTLSSLAVSGNLTIDTNTLFVDSSANTVGIKTTSPLETLDVRDYNGIAVNGNYCHVGSTVSGAMAIFGHNIKSDSTANTIKSANTGYHSSMIKMYYDEGISFHATSSTATAGDTFYDISGTTNELMRITNDGKVGIGTSSPSTKLHVQATGASEPLGLFQTTSTGDCAVRIEGIGGEAYLEIANTSGTTGDTSNSWGIGCNDDTNLHIAYGTNGTMNKNSDNAQFFINSSTGNVGIGTESPTAKLHVNLTGAGDVVKIQGNSITDFDFIGNPPEFNFEDSDGASGQKRARITLNNQLLSIQGLSDDDGALTYNFITCDLSNGRVGIGETGPSSTLHIKNSESNGVAGISMENDARRYAINVHGGLSDGLAIYDAGGGATRFFLASNGNIGIGNDNTSPSSKLDVNGSLSKSSGSFKIDHPLDSKKDTHHLVHSFVEGPQADNIYRGVVALENGSATINLDTVSGMTEGTFVALNTNTSCFTSNETDWDSVKGSISGNTLTISCQNTSSTATVSWLVIGERHDQHIMEANWTDDNGKVIVEPLKESE